MRSRLVLLATIDAGGTVPPVLGVAADLVGRGHRVRVLSDPTVEPFARAVGCDFTAWSRAPHFDSVDDQTATIAAAERGGPRRRFQAVDRFLGGRATRGYADDLLAAARAGADAVVVEAALPGLLLGAEASGLPSAGLVPNLYPRPTRGLPPLMTAWTPGTGPAGRLRDGLALGAAGIVTRGLARPVNRVRAEHGLAPVGDLFGPLDHLTRVLVLSSPGFDFPARLPANVRHVGPQLDDPPWAVHDEDWRPDGDGPLVLVAMSSVFQHQTAALRTVATALGSSPVRAVVTTGRAIRPEDVPAAPHVRVVRSAPHREVLREAAAVVTHAGHGTVMKALAAGVPLVCLPMGRDQQANTTRVLRLGAGVRVRPRSTAPRVAAAVRHVLTDPGPAAGARRAADLLAREAATRPNAADEIEGMLGGAPVTA